jgi:hypothetical protein
MKYMFNIEKSGFRPREYVGYGGGRAWRIRKHGCGGFEAYARDGAGYERADTLAKLSDKLAALNLPAIDRTR